MASVFPNRICLGNCFDLIKEIPAESIDAIITDPPYGVGKKGINDNSGLQTFYDILPECYRVMKSNSFFITFTSIKFLPNIFDNNPFKYFWQIVYYCPMGSVNSPVGFTKYMPVMVFSKGKPRICCRNKDAFEHPRGTKMIEPIEGFINHPALKPVGLLEQILVMFTEKEDIILDPFIGSGSTALACIRTGRSFIGFEISQEYVNLAKSRIKKLKVGTHFEL